MFTNKFLLDIYNNLDTIKNSFDNVLLSSYNLPINSENVTKILQHLISNKINMIRFDNLREIGGVNEIITGLKGGEELGQVFRAAKIKTGIETVADIPRYHFIIDHDKGKSKIDDSLIDETQVKKQDELSVIIKKYEDSFKHKHNDS